MHFRTTFFLLVLAVLLLSFVCLRETSNDSEAENAKTEVKLLDFEPEKVTYWSLAGEKGSVECLNEHGAWMIIKPFRTRARAAKVNYLLSVLAALPKGETITAAQRKARALSLADYGVEKPVYRAVVGSPEKRIEIDIGQVSPLKDSVYVRLNNGDTVVATATNLLEIIPRDLADIRDNHLLSGAPAYVKKLEIKSQKQPLIMVVKEGTEWILRKPAIARADWLKLSALLDTLYNAQVEQYVTDTLTDPSIYGLSDDEAILQIGVWQNEKEDSEYLFFGKKADEKGVTVYAGQRGKNSVFTVKSEIAQALTVGLSNIRDSRLFFMAPDSIASIRIEENNSVLQLARDPASGWQIIEPKKWKADERGVGTLIARLNSLRIEMFLAGTNAVAAGLEKPAKIISVADTPPLPALSNQPPAGLARALRLSAPIQGQEYVLGRFADEDEIYQLSASAVATISINPMMYRDSAILAFDPSAVTQVILHKNNLEQSVARQAGGAWKAVSPAAAEVNRKVIEDLLAAAAGLRALRFERDDSRAAAVYGLQPAAATLTLNLSGAEGISKTLLLGENSEDGGVYGMLQGQDIIFVLDKERVNLLTRDLVQ